jgi:hypothetical protein
MKTLSDAFTQLRVASKAALNSTAEISGQPNDPDLMLYNQLTPDTLNELSSTYGVDQMMEYVRTMEARKMGR